MSNREGLMYIRTESMFSEVTIAAAENAAIALEDIIFSDPSAANVLLNNSEFTDALEHVDSKKIVALELPDPGRTKPILEPLTGAVFALFETTNNGQYARFNKEVKELADVNGAVSIAAATARLQSSHEGTTERAEARRALTVKYLGYASLAAKKRSPESPETPKQQQKAS